MLTLLVVVLDGVCSPHEKQCVLPSALTERASLDPHSAHGWWVAIKAIV